MFGGNHFVKIFMEYKDGNQIKCGYTYIDVRTRVSKLTSGVQLLLPNY